MPTSSVGTSFPIRVSYSSFFSFAEKTSRASLAWANVAGCWPEEPSSGLSSSTASDAEASTSLPRITRTPALARWLTYCGLLPRCRAYCAWVIRGLSGRLLMVDSHRRFSGKCLVRTSAQLRTSSYQHPPNMAEVRLPEDLPEVAPTRVDLSHYRVLRWGAGRPPATINLSTRFRASHWPKRAIVLPAARLAKRVPTPPVSVTGSDV